MVLFPFSLCVCSWFPRGIQACGAEWSANNWIKTIFTILGTQMHAESQECAQVELARAYFPIAITVRILRIRRSDKLKADATFYVDGEAD